MMLAFLFAKMPPLNHQGGSASVFRRYSSGYLLSLKGLLSLIPTQLIILGLYDAVRKRPCQKLAHRKQFGLALISQTLINLVEISFCLIICR
jgi:hypothetical protein